MSKTSELKERLLRGDTLDSVSVSKEYGGLHKSTLTSLVRRMEAEGHHFEKTRSAFNQPYCFRLTSATSNGNGTEASPVETPQETPFERIIEWLLEGQHLSGSEVAARIGCKPQVLPVTMARLKEQGYQFEHEVQGKTKYWFIVGKGQPKPRNTRGTGGRATRAVKAIRMPAPNLEDGAEFLMVSRPLPDTVRFAVRQGRYTWTAEAIRCDED